MRKYFVFLNMLLNIALCDCSVHTDNHSLYLLLLFLKLQKKNFSVSKTKSLFFCQTCTSCPNLYQLLSLIRLLLWHTAHSSNTKKCFSLEYLCDQAKLFTNIPSTCYFRVFFYVPVMSLQFHKTHVLFIEVLCQSAFLLRIAHVSSHSYARPCVNFLYIIFFVLYFPLLTK